MDNSENRDQEEDERLLNEEEINEVIIEKLHDICKALGGKETISVIICIENICAALINTVLSNLEEIPKLKFVATILASIEEKLKY